MQAFKNRAPNTPKYTDRQFNEVWTGELGGVDEERFRLLMKHYKKGKILDVGCFDSPIPIWYEDSIGVDHGEETIKTLQEVYPEAEFLCADVMHLDFESGTFDYIVAGEIIEHMESPEDFILEMMRLLKQGGTLALSTPNDEHGRTPVSDQHKWSFKVEDIKKLLILWGDAEIDIFEESFQTIIAHVRKW